MWSSRHLFILALLIINIIALAVYIFGHVYLREKYANTSWPDIGLESSSPRDRDRPRPPSEVIGRMEKELEDMQMIKSMLVSETETQLAEQTEKGIQRTKQELIENVSKRVGEDVQKIMQDKAQQELRNVEAVKRRLQTAMKREEVKNVTTFQNSGRVTMEVDRVYAPFETYSSGNVNGGKLVVISAENADPSSFSDTFSSRLSKHFSSSRNAWMDTPFGYYIFMDKNAAMTYRVQVPRSGTYSIDLFVYAQQGNTDSFYMEVDGGGRKWWDIKAWKSAQFGFLTWKRVQWNKGQHTVTVSGREPTGFAAIRIRSGDNEDLPKSIGVSHRVTMRPGQAVPPLATYNSGLVKNGDYLVIDEQNPDPTRFKSSFNSRMSKFASKKNAWDNTPFGYYVFLSKDTVFTYVFDAPSDGVYDIELFVIAEQGNTDSFYMEVDGNGRKWWDIKAWKSSRFGYLRWKRQKWSRGVHTLSVHGREPTGLAAVRISAA